jgi:hypothetical protein
MALGILLLLAAIAALCWKKQEMVPAVKHTTVKPWIPIVLFILAILCFASSSSSEPKKAKESKDNAIPVRIGNP